MATTPISWLGTFLPMLSVTDHKIVTTDAFPMHTEVGFYVGAFTLVTWAYDPDTCEVTRYVTAVDDGVDLEVTTWDLSATDTFGNAYLAMVTLSSDLATWARKIA